MPAEMKLEDLFRDDSETCPFVGFSNEETEKVKKNSAAKILDLQQQLAIENGVVKQEEIDVPVEEELFSYPVDGIKTELSATFGGIKEEQIECRISSFTLIKSEPTDYVSPSYCNNLHDIKPNGLVIPKEEPVEKGSFKILQNVCSDSVDGAKTKRTIKPKLSGNEFVSAADDIIQKMVSKTQQAPILIVPIKRLPQKVTQNTINVRTLDDCVDLAAPAGKGINSKTPEVISTALDESNFDELPDVSVPFEMSVESYGIQEPVSSHLSASSKPREISQDNQKQNSSCFPIRTPCSVFHECSIPANEIPSPNPRSITLPLLPKDFVFQSVVDEPSKRTEATPSSGEPAVADDVVLFFDALIDSAYTFCPEEFSLPGNIIRIKGYKENESYSCESSEELHSKRPKRKYTRRAGHNEEFVPPQKKRKGHPPARPGKKPREDYDTAMPPPLSIITRNKGRKSKIDSAPDSNTILSAIENVVKNRKSKIDSAPDSNTILNAIENVVKSQKSKIDSAPDSNTILNAIENVVKTSCPDHANVTKKKGRSTHVNESLPVVDDSLPQSSSENIAGPPVSSNLWLQYSSHLYQDESKRTKQKKKQIRKVQTFVDNKKTGNSELPKKKKQDFNSSVDVFMLERELNRDQQRLSLMKVEYEAQRSSIERLRKSLIKETKLLIEKEKIKQQNSYRNFEKVRSTVSHSEDMLNFDSLSEGEDFMNFSSNLSVTNLLSSPGKVSLAFDEFSEFSDFDASSLLSPFDSLDSEKHKFPFLGASNSRIPNNEFQLSSGYPRTNHSPFLNSAEALDKIRSSKSALNSKPVNGRVQNRGSNSFPNPSSRTTPAPSSESRNSTATRLAESLCEALKTKDSLNAAKKFHHQQKSHANYQNEINLPNTNASRPATLNNDAFKKPLSPLNSLLNKYRKRFYCY